MAQKKILITGSSGFIGSNLVEKFYKENYRVRCLVRKTSNLKFIKKYQPELVFGDVTDLESLINAVNGVDYIIHSAAVLRALKKERYYEVNQDGSKNLIEAALKYNKNLKKFIFISTLAAVGPSPPPYGQQRGSNNSRQIGNPVNPITDYGLSKFLAEQELLKYKDIVNLIILRPTAVYGPMDKDIYQFFKFLKFGIGPILSDSYLQLLFVKDLSEICYKICESDLKDGIYFVGEEKGYTWAEIYEIISKALDKKIIKLRIHPFFLKIASFLDETYNRIKGKPALLNRQKVDELLQNWLCDTSHIKNLLGFRYTPLEKGVKITYNWYIENGWL